MVVPQTIERWPPPVDIPITESYETLESGLQENSIEDIKDR